MKRKIQILLPILALLATWLPAQTTTPPNDPMFPLQWGYNNTGQVPRYDNPNILVGCNDCDADVVEAWAQTTGSESVTIAILDGGVEFAHPEFDIKRLWVNPGEIAGDGVDNDGNGYVDDVHGWDFEDNDNNIDDARLAHGTAMYSIIAAKPNNNVGLAGIDWKAKIMVLRVADRFGRIDLNVLTDAIEYAADNGADIMSMSFGYQMGLQPGNNLPNFTAANRNTLQTAINYAYNQGVAIFASTGNDDQSVLEYPAAFSNVMGIGAASPCNTRKRGSNSLPLSCDNDSRGEFNTPTWGSNYGAYVDLLAPGTLLPSADATGTSGYSANTNYFNSTPDGNFLYNFYGTSIATPFVAGVAGLMLAENPALTNAEIYSILRSSATEVGPPGFDNESGHGMVNALSAVINAQGCTGVPVNLTVANQNIAVPGVYRATNTITVGPTVNITQPVTVNFVAENSITFKANFTMVPGTSLEARLADPCASSKTADGDDGDGENFPWIDEPEANPWLESPRLEGFPNPFAGTATLRFTLPTADKAVLQVYNLKGEQVAVLFDGEVDQGQAIEVVFDGSALPGGIYLAKLATASGSVLTQRLLLQR